MNPTRAGDPEAARPRSTTPSPRDDTGDLVGRGPELTAVHAFLRAASAMGGALLLCGEPGVGRTALLEAAVGWARRHGVRVLDGASEEFRAVVAPGDVADLLRPSPRGGGRHDRTPGPDGAGAPHGSSGTSSGRVERQFAALALVRDLGREEPLLLVVDDLQDLDRESVRTLAFVARRLRGSRVGLLASVASRDGVTAPDGLPSLHVPPLADADATCLVRDRSGELPAHVVRQVVARAAGNPLALLELATVAARTGRAAGGAHPAARAACSRTHDRSAARLHVLPSPPQEALLVVAGADREAADVPGATGTLEARGAAGRVGPVDVERGSGAVRFRLQRGDAPAAASSPARSVALGRPGAPRGGCSDGASCLEALGTGDFPPTAVRLPAARRADRSAGSLPDVMSEAHRLLHGDGEAAVAQQLLVGALAERHSGRAEPAAAEGLDMLVDIAACVGRRATWATVRTSLDRRLGPSTSVQLRAAVLADPARVGRQHAAALDDAIGGLVDEPDPVRITRLAAAGLALDRVAGCREPLRRALAGGGRGPAVPAVMTAYGLLCAGDVASGRWEEAGGLAAEGMDLCELHGHRLPAAQLRLTQALLAAARGNEVLCRSLVEAVCDWAAPRGLQALLDEGRRVSALAALGRGDAESAYRHATAVTPAGRLAECSSAALRVSMDLVEAAVRLGRQEEARQHAQAMRDAPARSVSPRFDMLTAASAALTADPATAAEWFDEALAVPDADRWPFDQARVQLAYGEHLRAQRRLGASRAQLEVALDTFVRLGAQPWAARARSGLRATGVTIGGPVVPAELTHDEWTVAGLAAEGLTNKQIARRLMISHSTVAARLYRVFPKLGVGSRAALGTAMRALDDRVAQPQVSGTVPDRSA